jgi:hypothetical protein
MPAYHGKSKILVCRHIMAKSKMSVCQHILAWTKFQYAGISWHEQSFSMPASHAIVKFQYASISWQEQNFSMPAYHGKEQNFSMSTYHGINQNPQSPFISVRHHIKASINNSYRRLFRHASISRHSIILSVIANSGSVTYRDIGLKANKHHISYHIRFHRVFRFSILTCLIIFAY